jgi:hypothetical protein
MPATPTTGEFVYRIDAQVRELKEAGALDEASLLELSDILREISSRFTMIERILEGRSRR